ncbi:MAG: DEAD/DEAH box helicase family protein [Saprospiraceae bacterium]|uniref:DEAD/DEAH box helicase family protein n=1 Tax=Candidatus Defluviibacterium haderslevense TaxID=2981993 RepID=A0A9D7S6Y0_9BACT|nr:DEAD/DEAH box helicase family protein [Candidatus Defluviibacterium haderslevense]
MELKLENLKYQDDAIQAVVKVFDGTEKNTFDNACFEGIRSNVSKLSFEQLQENIKSVAEENGIELETLNLTAEKDLTIEMETGTGKTLVYIKTIYELYKHYGFTKFIILVPSVAIRQGVLGTFNSFNSQLESIYGFKPNAFEYDSKKLSKVTNFIEDQHPQVMIMTLASFNSEDKILNQAQREDLFANIPFIDAIGKTNPIILMDEPQEGMDTENSVKQIAKLNPLFKIRYSATHKAVKNLLYRLTPYDSYKQGLVKKIEVLTVTEKNDEATIKIELAETQNGTSAPKAKLKAWHQSNSTNKFDFKLTAWLKVGDNLGEKTNNPSYLNYKVERINKSLKSGKWSITFSNGVELFEKQASGNLENIWALQLEWLIHRHFAKTQKLATNGIKCLSLIFIDRVANYMGETPVIKNLFIEKYKGIYPEYNDGKDATDQHIQDIQGYYFAQKASGEYADNEGGVKEQGKIYELILKGKEELLTISNPVQFIFSHSALGVGWDNPNVFNIATLNTAYSEIRKRQEIGRGLRICVNQDGQRIYDALTVEDAERINQLTVIPNETYETFVTQYQEEIKAIYGSTKAGAGMTHTHKGKPQDEVQFKRNPSDTIDAAFKRFWKSLAKKTDYTIAFNEENLIETATQRINAITIPDYVIEASSHLINEITDEGKQDTFGGTESIKQKARFTPLDLVEELSENTGLSYNTLFKIVEQLTNHNELIKNPPRYIHEAAAIIRNIELDEMLRGLDYHLIGESYPFSFNDFIRNVVSNGYVDTPNKGVFDKMLIDSDVERQFSLGADRDPEIVCFIKLPSWYKIKTPIGEYEPDFGLIMKRKELKSGNEKEFYFVLETKGTNNINDKKALTESEVYKIKCAMKHFTTLGVEVHYNAPIKDYQFFRTEADKTINKVIEQA